jgi:serine/threonine protein kinase
MTRALNVIDGILAGLEAMHGASIAHLDVKPSNAILREGSADPVLVDFGLAGRHIRPGCATLCYGAPEIWETPAGSVANGQAWAADVYAFGCMAYEVLTGRTLFDGNSDVAIISAHVTHDGLPPPVHRMSQNPTLQPLSMFLYQCLRNNPNHRANTTELRRELGKMRPTLERRSWPLHLD